MVEGQETEVGVARDGGEGELDDHIIVFTVGYRLHLDLVCLGFTKNPAQPVSVEEVPNPTPSMVKLVVEYGLTSIPKQLRGEANG
ncbi:hypothetical protein BHE74_00049325 [Ensete ventricosum]|nr:hypothetical protein BHE74_00049325 [Ensete ventricosum]